MIAFKAVMALLPLALHAVASPIKATGSTEVVDSSKRNNVYKAAGISAVTTPQDAGHSKVCDICEHYEVPESAYNAAYEACTQLTGQKLGLDGNSFSPTIITSVIFEFVNIFTSGLGKYPLQFNFAMIWDDSLGRCQPLESTMMESCMNAFDDLFQECQGSAHDPESTFVGWSLDMATCVTYQASVGKGGLGARCDEFPLTEPPTNDDYKAIVPYIYSDHPSVLRRQNCSQAGCTAQCQGCHQIRENVSMFSHTHIEQQGDYDAATKQACSSLVGYTLGKEEDGFNPQITYAWPFGGGVHLIQFAVTFAPPSWARPQTCNPAQITFEECTNAFRSLGSICGSNGANDGGSVWPDANGYNVYQMSLTGELGSPGARACGFEAQCRVLKSASPTEVDVDANKTAFANVKRQTSINGQSWVCSRCMENNMQSDIRIASLEAACDRFAGFPVSIDEKNITYSETGGSPSFAGSEGYPVHYDVLYEDNPGCTPPLGILNKADSYAGFRIIDEQCAWAQGYNLDIVSCITYQINGSPNGVGTLCD